MVNQEDGNKLNPGRCRWSRWLGPVLCTSLITSEIKCHIQGLVHTNTFSFENAYFFSPFWQRWKQIFSQLVFAAKHESCVLDQTYNHECVRPGRVTEWCVLFVNKIILSEELHKNILCLFRVYHLQWAFLRICACTESEFKVFWCFSVGENANVDGEHFKTKMSFSNASGLM